MQQDELDDRPTSSLLVVSAGKTRKCILNSKTDQWKSKCEMWIGNGKVSLEEIIGLFDKKKSRSAGLKL